MNTVDTVTHAIAEMFNRKKFLIHTQLNMEWSIEYTCMFAHI